MSEAEIWFWCILVGWVSAVTGTLILYRLTRLRQYDSPPCHVVGCNRRVVHSHRPRYGDCYDVNYFCPQHTGELMEPDVAYVVEPWATELSDRAIHELIHSEWHWERREAV